MVVNCLGLIFMVSRLCLCSEPGRTGPLWALSPAHSLLRKETWHFPAWHFLDAAHGPHRTLAPGTFSLLFLPPLTVTQLPLPNKEIPQQPGRGSGLCWVYLGSPGETEGQQTAGFIFTVSAWLWHGATSWNILFGSCCGTWPVGPHFKMKHVRIFSCRVKKQQKQMLDARLRGAHVLHKFFFFFKK